MDKKTALKVLIEHSFLLSPTVKVTLLMKINDLTDIEMESIGKMLAQEKKKSLDNAYSIIQTLDQFEKKLRSYEEQ